MKSKKYRKTLTLVTCVMVAMLLLAGCGGGADTTPEDSSSNGKETITLRISGGQPETAPWITYLSESFCGEVSQKVSENTDYEIEWIKGFSGSMLKLGEALEGIEAGICDMGITVLPLEPAKLKLLNMFYYMPFASPDAEIGAQALMALFEEYPQFTEIYDEYNSMYLGIAFTEPYNMFSTYEVKSINDLDGYKVGAVGANLTWVEGSGCATVQSNLMEMFTSLQTGVYQVGIQPSVSTINLKVHEVAPYILDASFGAFPANALIMNKDSYAKLPSEVQEIIVEAAKNYTETSPEYVMNTYDAAIETALSEGATMNQLSVEEQKEWAEMIPNSLGKFIGELEEMGYPAGEMADFYFNELEKLGQEKIRDWEY